MPNWNFGDTILNSPGLFGKGRRTSMYDASGRHFWQYDQRGRVTLDALVIDGHYYPTDYGWDAMDRKVLMQWPGTGLLLLYTYGDHGKLTRIKHDPSFFPLDNVVYNQLMKPHDLVLGSGYTTTLSYYGDGLDAPGAPYGYLKGIATTKSQSPTTQDLAHIYDAVGNLVTWKDNAANPPEDFTYGYDDLDRVTSKKITGNPNNLEWFNYDQLGNVTNKGDS